MQRNLCVSVQLGLVQYVHRGHGLVVLVYAVFHVGYHLYLFNRRVGHDGHFTGVGGAPRVVRVEIDTLKSEDFEQLVISRRLLAAHKIKCFFFIIC